MWSEEIDKKIREAAGNDIPAYDERAWETMEPLLDKHLPKEKKRRWFLLLFLSFLVTSSVVFFILQRTSSDNASHADKKELTIQSNKIIPTSSTSEPTIKQSRLVTNSNPPVTNPETKEVGEINQDFKTVPRPAITGNEIPAKKVSASSTKNIPPSNDNPKLTYAPIAKKDLVYRQTKIAQRKTKPKSSKKDDSNNMAVITQDGSSIPPGAVTIKAAAQQETPQNSAVVLPTTDTSLATKQADIAATTPKKDSTEEVVAPVPVVVRKDNKAKSNKSGKFSINLSLGPDISSVGIDNPGKLKMQYGIGIGYALSKKISLRAGFYASRKIYKADSADYHPPKAFWTYFDNLQTIDANCLVYEIPVNVVYNFSSSGKHNWFASAGLSSYLMKKETYNYLYKDSWNQPQIYSRSYKNENSHFFSVLSISGGYQYHLTDRFSLMAEPYMKMPLTGVGFGKVKLNSGGLLFTASFRPFLKKK